MLYNKLAVFTALLAMVYGAPSKSSPSVIELPLKKTKHDGISANLTRRDTLPEQKLGYSRVRYYANYTLGGQPQTGMLDSGSSDLWTFSNQAVSGGYNPEESTTYTKLNDNFSDSYGGGNSINIQGTWATETVGLGGAEVPNFVFGYVNQTTSSFSGDQGIFAIGPKQGEHYYPQHPTFVESLKDNGVIQSNSFSLYNDNSDSAATLLIGGIDTAKFKGPLYTLGLDTTELDSQRYYIVNFEFQGTTYSNGILDTGTAAIQLPTDVADSIAQEYGANWDPRGGYVRNSPPPANQPGLDFQIGGVNVTVPGSDLWTQVDDYWFFGITRSIQNGLSQDNILGDPILKQLFIFFDVDNSQIAFAPVVYTDESNLVPVGDTIPNSTPAPNQTEGGGVGSAPKCIIC